jgi:hypothetical protein
MCPEGQMYFWRGSYQPLALNNTNPKPYCEHNTFAAHNVAGDKIMHQSYDIYLFSSSMSATGHTRGGT